MKMDAKQIEKLIKGLANSRRVGILMALNLKNPLTIEEIEQRIPMNYKTLNMHLQRLYGAELIDKEFKGQLINIYLTNRARQILTFLRKLE